MLEFLIILLITIPFAGAWATWKFWKWHKFYGTRFLWGLFIVSLVADLSGLPIALIALRRLLVGPDASPLPGTGEILSFSIILLESAFVYLVFRWRDLDKDTRRVRVFPEDEQSSVNLPPPTEGSR